MEIFLKGLTHDSGQQLEFFLSLLLNKKRLEIMFPDHPVRKQAYLDWKIKDFTKSPYGDFFKGVNPWFWSKIRIFSFNSF